MNRDLRMVASFLLVLCLIAQSAFANGSVAQFSTRPLTFSIPELAHSSINKEALSAAFLSSTIAFSSARKPLKARVGFLKQATEPINHEPSARRRPARIGVHNPLEILL